MREVFEVIAVVRDVVVILSAIIIAAMVVIVGRVFLRLTRTVGAMTGFVTNTVTTLLNPIKGVLLAISRTKDR